jgi:hypothetical protein
VHRARRRAHGDLSAGDEADPETGRGISSLGETTERVVVGQRERADTERMGVLEQRSGRQRPVGGRRMAVEIDR